MTDFQDTTLAASPYYDDFDATKNYLRVLFKPGQVVQSRELTQAQTILHNQLSSFANHVFKDGSSVLGGEVEVDYDAQYLIVVAGDWYLDNGNFDTPIGDVATDLLGRYIRGATSNAYAKIVKIDTDTGTNPVSYRLHLLIKGGTFIATEQLFTDDYDDEVYASQYISQVIGCQSVNSCIKAYINPGIVYIGGSFVRVNSDDTREVYVNSIDQTGTYKIGFRLVEEVYDVADDDTLRDPANGALNYNAPGADRYRVSILLESYADGAELPDDFYEVVAISETVITKQQNKVQYADIINMLARRTYDESGSYTVEPFSIEAIDYDNDNLQYVVSHGKAYVQGFEVETLAPSRVVVPKARDYKAQTNAQQVVSFGKYVDVIYNSGDDISGGWFAADRHPTVYLMSSTNGTGTQIGTATLLYAKRSGNVLRCYLGQSTSLSADLALTKSLASEGNGSPTFYGNISDFSPDNQSAQVCPIIETYGAPIKQVLTASYTTTQVFRGVLSTASSLVINTGSTEIDFISDYTTTVTMILKKSPDTVLTISDYSGTITGNGEQLEINGLPDGTYDIYARINKIGYSPRTKTLYKKDFNFTPSGSTSYKFSTEGYYDIAAIELIEETGTLLDVTDSITWDSGQRDTYYDYGTIHGLTDGTQYHVILYHYVHNNDGDFFVPNSYYKGTVTYFDDKGGVYANIPLYRNESKSKTYDLVGCLDFRRNITEIGTSLLNLEPFSNVGINYEYYLPRYDKIWIDTKGNIDYTQGVSSENPGMPPEKENTLTLFTAELPPYVFDVANVTTAIIDTKNYTMEEIGDLETRIRNLEYNVANNQLALEAEALQILDVNGLNKHKNGIFTDNFHSHEWAEVGDPDYRAIMEYEAGILRCPFEYDWIDFEPPGGGGDDTETLPYTTETYVEQSKATNGKVLIETPVTVFEGQMKLAPDTDNWVYTKEPPNRNIPDRKTKDKLQYLYVHRQIGKPNWNSWKTEILGEDPKTLKLKYKKSHFDNKKNWTRFPTIDSVSELSDTDNSLQVNKQITEESHNKNAVNKSFGDRVVDITASYYMRTLPVTYIARGMKPDTTLLAYFGDTDVSAYCSNLTTDARGQCVGVFTIPEKTFRSGVLNFTLKDSVNDPTTIAVAQYTAMGLLKNKNKGLASCGAPKMKTKKLFKNKVIGTTTTEIINSIPGVWQTPVAQSFTVESSGGMYIDSIDLYFAKIDTELDVTVSIVSNNDGLPTENGCAFAEKTLNSDDITASRYDPTTQKFYYVGGANHNQEIVAATDFVATNFQFPDPIFLQDGEEYSVVVETNSPETTIYLAELGKPDLITGKVISKSPYSGVFFNKKLDDTWEANENLDFKFKINKCVFSSSGQFEYTCKPLAPKWNNVDTYVTDDEVVYVSGSHYGHYIALQAVAADTPPSILGGDDSYWQYLGLGAFDVDMICIGSDRLELSKSGIENEYILDSLAAYTQGENKENIQLESRDIVELFDTSGGNTPKQLKCRFTLTTDDPNISPCLHKKRQGCVVIRNEVIDLGAQIPKYDAGKHITVPTQLRKPAQNIRVLLDVWQASTSDDVKVYVKTTTENKKYAPWDAATGTLYSSLKDNIIYVYHFDDDLTVGATKDAIGSFAYKSKAVCDGVDVTNQKIYLSSIENYADYKLKTNVGANGHIMITSEPFIDASEIFLGIDASVTYNKGEYTIYGGDLWVAQVTNTNIVPSETSDTWKKIDASFLDGVIAAEDFDWQECQRISEIPQDFDVSSDYIEHEYEPIITPSEEFDTFAIKIEMFCNDPTKVPLCKKLRAIAVK